MSRGLCLGRLPVVTLAVGRSVVFEQKVTELTLGGEVFEALVAVWASVAVW